MAIFRSHGAMVILYAVPVILGVLEIAGWVGKIDNTSTDMSGLTPSFQLIAETYPNSPEADVVRGVNAKYLRFDLVEAREHFERAIGTGIKGHSLLFYEHAVCLHLMQAKQSVVDDAVTAWRRNDPASPLADPRTLKRKFPAWQRAGAPRTLALCRNGRQFAVASSAGPVSLVDLLSDQRHSFDHAGLDHLLEFSHDGSLLVAGDSDGGVIFLNTEESTVKAIHNLHEQTVLSAAFSYDDSLCATGDDGGAIHIWETSTLTAMAGWKGHTRAVSSMAFSEDGKQLASGDWDGTIRLWDLSLTKPESTILKYGEAAVTALAFSPDGTWLCSASRNNQIRIHDLKNGATPGALAGHTAPVSCVAFSSSGSLLASGSADRTVRFWDSASGRQVGQEDIPAQDGVCSVVFAPGGGLVIAADFNGSIHQVAVPAGH